MSTPAFVSRATHEGTLATAFGEVPGTGRTIEIRTIDVLTVKDDKVTGIVVVNDDATMLQQLGLTLGRR